MRSNLFLYFCKLKGKGSWKSIILHPKSEIYAIPQLTFDKQNYKRPVSSPHMMPWSPGPLNINSLSLICSAFHVHSFAFGAFSLFRLLVRRVSHFIIFLLLDCLCSFSHQNVARFLTVIFCLTFWHQWHDSKGAVGTRKTKGKRWEWQRECCPPWTVCQGAVQ
jgi:hypothetical protein